MTLLWKIFSFFLKTPWEGAQTSVYCAVAEELDSVTGQYFRWVQADEVIHCGRLPCWLGNMRLSFFIKKGLGMRLSGKNEGERYENITPVSSVAIVLEKIPDLCNTAHNSRSFSARNINVLKVAVTCSEL